MTKPSTIAYTTRGPVRGTCGHRHRSIETAAKCVLRDGRDCRSLGGGAYSDRRVVAVEAGAERELTGDEFERYENEIAFLLRSQG